MKKLLYIFIATVICLSWSVSSVAADDWKVIFLTDKQSNTHTGVEFHKNGKKAFGLKFNEPYRIGFMVPLNNDPVQKYRFVFKGIYKQDEQDFKIKDYLIDIKGNGDKRYLLITNWGGGNRGPFEHGYLIDTKDNFAIVGRVPTGEVYDYPMPNEELIFKQFDTLESFSMGRAANVFIEYKLRKGKRSLWVGKVDENKYFSLEEYRNILMDKNCSDAREYALARLYCDLASEGLLKYFYRYARYYLNFNDNEIAETGEYYCEKLRKSKFYKYIKKLNGNLQIRPLISDDEAFLQDWISVIADPEMARAATMNWSREYSYDVVYAENGFVSYYCGESSYTGGAHGSYHITVGTLYRGKRLQLANLPELDKIKKLFHQALESREDFEDMKKYNCGKEIKMTENFYIDEKGIHFIYSPYEIHCYAAGIIDIFVPYNIKVLQ